MTPSTKPLKTLSLLGIIAFSIGLSNSSNAQAPGGVSANLRIWLKADMGFSPASWTDQSGSGNNFNQINASRRPSLQAANTKFNFYPAVDFTTAGGGQFMVVPSGRPFTANNLNGTVFVLANHNAISGNQDYLGFGSTTTGSGIINANAPVTGQNSAGNPYWFDGDWPTSTGIANVAGITSLLDWRWTYNASTAQPLLMRRNGKLGFSTNILTNDIRTFNGAVLGAQPEVTNAAIPEVIAYERVLNASEMQRVQSYLAIKYGIALDQATPISYVASDGTTVFWDAASAGIYKNNVALIANDAGSGLVQKQSKSSSAGLQIITGLGTIAASNAANGASFGADKSSMAWADNGLPNAFNSTVTGVAGVRVRLDRVWQVQEVGSVGTVTIAFPGSASNLQLLVSNDPTFATGITAVPMTITQNIGGVNHFTCTFDFANGQYFTFASAGKSPGGVVTNLRIWLTPETGFTPSIWTDQSPAGNNFTQTNAIRQPSAIAASRKFNFNPAVNFSNASGGQFMVVPTGGPFTSNNRDGSIFIMANHHTIDANQDYLGFDGTTTGSAISSANFPAVGQFSTGQPYWFDGDWPGATGIANQVGITSLLDFRWTYSASTALPILMHSSGKLGHNTPFIANLINTAQGAILGAQPEVLNAAMPEVIAYERNLTATEMQQVRSYLAVKYGNTLDQTTPYDYLASDGTTKIWDAALGGVYNKNIAAIGRDDVSGLVQKQSSSILPGNQVVIGIGTIAASNAANSALIASDKTFASWGDNGLSGAFNVAFGLVPGTTVRMSRVWRMQEQNTVGPVTVAWTGTPPGLHLIVSNDPSFATIVAAIPMTTTTLIDGVVHSTAQYDFASGNYFSFAAVPFAPGGVGADLRIWLKADDGFTPNFWADKSPADNDFTQTNASRQPSLLASNQKFNFNPAVDFPSAAGGRFMVVPNGKPFTAADRNGTMFVLANHNSINTNQDYLGLGATTTTSTPIDANSPAIGQFSTGQPFWFPGGWPSATGIANVIDFNSLLDWRWTYNTGVPSQALFMARNGVQGHSAAINTGNLLTSSGAVLGAQVGEETNAAIPEVIAYERVLTATELQRVRSYMAIRYGVTLNQTPLYDYLASNGSTKIWDATAATATYSNNIAVIGRDNTSLLHQKQSRSINTGTQQLVIAIGSVANSNPENTNSFANNNTFLAIGDNNLAVNTPFSTVGNQVSFSFPPGSDPDIRYNRVWMAQNTGVTQSVQVRIPTAMVGAISLSSCQKLVIISSATVAGFSSSASATNLVLNGSNYEASIKFPAGNSYFTIARLTEFPPGAVVVPNENVEATVAEDCKGPGGFKYYFYDAGKTQKAFAINWNGNTEPIGVVGRLTYSSSPLTATDGVEQLNILGRMFELLPAGGSFTANGGVKLRIFYDQNEFEAARIESATFERWFKFPGNAGGVINNNNGKTITGAAFYNPSSVITGTEDGFPYVEISTIQSFSTFGFASKTGTTVLPVVLTSFDVADEKCLPALSWASATETNFKEYQVQASDNGREFVTIASIAGKGSNATYRYVYTTNTGANWFRLKMVDKDGSESYSKVQRYAPACATAVPLRVSPNPARTSLLVSNLGSGDKRIDVIGPTGNTLQQFKTTQEQITVSVAKLPPAIYFIRVQYADGTMKQVRFMKE